MSDMQKIIARYAERFADTDTAIRKILCLDLTGAADESYGEILYDDFDIAEDDLPEVLGPWWEKAGEGMMEDLEPGEKADMLFTERGGWLLQAHTPLPYDIEFREDGRPRRWRTGGVYAETTVYAPTLPEALERLAVKCERRVDAEFNKVRALRGLPTPEGE